MSQYNDEYRKLVIKVLTEGHLQDCRNGKQLVIPHYSFVIDNLKDDHTLLLRKTYSKGIRAEFDTIMDTETPLTNVKQFEDRGCNYWKANAGPNGELNLDYYNMLHPQLEEMIAEAKADPSSRRLVVELWNYKNYLEGNLSLPVCWKGFIISIIDNTVHMTFNTRSQDLMLGTQADVLLAWYFMEHICNETGYKPGSCMYVMSNIHIYTEHIENAYKLVTDRTIEDFDKPLKFQLKA